MKITTVFKFFGHILLIVFVYGMYAYYPAYQEPFWFRNGIMLVGMAYAVAAILTAKGTLESQGRVFTQRAALFWVMAALLAMAEPIGNARSPEEIAQMDARSAAIRTEQVQKN